MTENIDMDWVDRYLRNELSSEDEARFEEAMLVDADLQAEVEAALGIRAAMSIEAFDEVAHPTDDRPRRNPWTSLAMAASVLLAVVSTTLYWRSEVENGYLVSQLDALQQPRVSVLEVPVNIMRSGAEDSADVIIQIPDGNSVLILDIELSSRLRQLPLVQFSLEGEAVDNVFAWAAAPDPDGRAVVVLNPDSIHSGQAWLLMGDPTSEAQERRLLEFR